MPRKTAQVSVTTRTTAGIRGAPQFRSRRTAGASMKVSRIASASGRKIALARYSAATIPRTASTASARLMAISVRIPLRGGRSGPRSSVISLRWIRLSRRWFDDEDQYFGPETVPELAGPAPAATGPRRVSSGQPGRSVGVDATQTSARHGRPHARQPDASVGTDRLDRRLGLGAGLVDAVPDHHGGGCRRFLVDHDALLVGIPHDVKLVDRQRRGGKRNHERGRYQVFEHVIFSIVTGQCSAANLVPVDLGPTRQGPGACGTPGPGA